MRFTEKHSPKPYLATQAVALKSLGISQELLQLKSQDENLFVALTQHR